MSNGINDDIIEKVHDSSDLVSIVSEYLPLKQTGSNYLGLCPFHNEKTPSFSVSRPKQFFKCFGCGEGGDVITFIMKMENLSFVESVKFLADKYGIPLDENRKVDKKLESQKDRIYKINKETARYYYKNLIEAEKPLKYLKDRKISRQVLNQFGLGYSIDSWNNVNDYLKGKGYKEEDIEKAGIIGRRKDKKGYYDKFRNRIMFPIIDTRGRIIGFGGRVLDESMPKYLNSQDTPVFSKGYNLYGLNLLRQHSNRERIILVEGYMDVIALFNYGINYSVASLGTAFTQNQAKLLKRYGKQVYICYDSDKAGLNATMKALNILKKEGVEPKVIALPSGQDPDDFINENGLEKFEELIDGALNYVEYNIFINKKKYDLSNPEDNIGFTKEIARILKGLKSPIEKDVYIDQVSRETGISKEAIKREILGKNYNRNTSSSKDKYINSRYRNNNSKIMPVKNILESAHLTAEKTLIKLMMEDRVYYNLIKENLLVEDFFNYECNILANLIFKQYTDKSEEIKLDSEVVLKQLENRDNINIDVINEIINKDINYLPENKTELIDDLLNTIRRSKLKIKRKEVGKKIKEIESKENKDEFDEEEINLLFLQITEIDRELQ